MTDDEQLNEWKKRATQRGARLQLMWEWMQQTAPNKSYDRISDHFLWDKGRGASSWFDDDGVPK